MNKNVLQVGLWLVLAFCSTSQAQFAITEVYSAGSSNGTYAADWFELTNFGPNTLSIAGWKMDNNSQSPFGAFALRGITEIAAGQSVVFVEGNASGSTDATIAANFITAWFGATPNSLVIGGYGGTGISLSDFSDQVNLYNPASATPNIPVTTVEFSTATVGRTFDNAAGLSSYIDPFPAITDLSTVGVNGAFLSANGAETGSPGAVPEPSTWLMLVAFAALLTKKFSASKKPHPLTIT